MYPTMGSALTMRSPSTTMRSRSTPWVAGCWGPMLSTMSAVARPPAPMPTVSSRCPPVVVMPAILPHRPLPGGGSAGAAREVVHRDGAALVVQADQDAVLGGLQSGNLLHGGRPGLLGLVRGDAVVVEDPGVLDDGDVVGQLAVLVLEGRALERGEGHAVVGEHGVVEALEGPPVERDDLRPAHLRQPGDGPEVVAAAGDIAGGGGRGRGGLGGGGAVRGAGGHRGRDRHGHRTTGAARPAAGRQRQGGDRAQGSSDLLVLHGTGVLSVCSSAPVCPAVSA